MIVITLQECTVQHIKDLSVCGQYYFMYEQKTDIEYELEWN